MRLLNLRVPHRPSLQKSTSLSKSLMTPSQMRRKSLRKIRKRAYLAQIMCQAPVVSLQQIRKLISLLFSAANQPRIAGQVFSINLMLLRYSIQSLKRVPLQLAFSKRKLLPLLVYSSKKSRLKPMRHLRPPQMRSNRHSSGDRILKQELPFLVQSPKMMLLCSLQSLQRVHHPYSEPKLREQAYLE